MKPLLAIGARYIPKNNASPPIIVAPIKYGLKNRVNDTPELKNAIISVLFASLDVNHITDRNKNRGNNKCAK